MPYPDMSQVPQPCWTCTSCQEPRRANRNQSLTRFTAIFTNDWNRSFNSKNHRPRRRRFARSGETISCFAPVFCEDWKDGENEVEQSTPTYDEYVFPQKCRRFIRDIGCKRKCGADDFAGSLTSIWSPYKGQYEQHYNSWTATSSTPQQNQFGAPAPSSRATPECLTPPFIIPVSDDETFVEGCARPGHPSQSLPSLKSPDFIDIATKMERCPYPISVADESGDPLSALKGPFIKVEDIVVPLRDDILDQHWFSEDDRGTGDGGFDHWDRFIEWSIRDRGHREHEDCQDLDTSPEMSVGHDFD
ncbi:hypothetical protein V498_06284 [Pseudogymnoascus sp. VKM F-4517 (FW-2822)]|nr:hypothetical protein V498_06284 [Pseudogymnoascus sp. VKM F-4517 (FW-2822)]